MAGCRQCLRSDSHLITVQDQLTCPLLSFEILPKPICKDSEAALEYFAELSLFLGNKNVNLALLRLKGILDSPTVGVVPKI